MMKLRTRFGTSQACVFLLLLLLWVNAATALSASIWEVIDRIPRSAKPCLYAALDEGKCKLSKLPECLCPNTALMANISSCVQETSPFEDQVEVALAAADLCVGYPIESRSSHVRLVSIACAAIIFPVVILRCLARLLVGRRLWWDDWLAISATLCLAALIGIEIKGTQLGFGRHYWNCDPRNATPIFQIYYAFQLLYVVVQVLAKSALVAFYSRIFPSPKFRIAVWVMIAFLVGHGVIYLGILAFQCMPLASIWDKNIIGKCLNLSVVGYSGAAFAIVEDIAIIVMPIPELLKLQLSNTKKAALLFMFSLGSFACVTSMVRLKYLIAFANTPDPSWDNVSLVIWSVIELSCALICASLPALRPLLRKIPDALSSISRSSQKGSSDKRESAAVWVREDIPMGRFKELPPLPPDASFGDKEPPDTNVFQKS